MYKNFFKNYFKNFNLYFSISFLFLLSSFYIIIYIEKIFHLNILNNYLPDYLNYIRINFFYDSTLFYIILSLIFSISMLIEDTDKKIKIKSFIKTFIIIFNFIYIIIFFIIYFIFDNNLFLSLNYNNLSQEQQIKIKEITKNKFINEKLFIYEDIINKNLNEMNLKKYNQDKKDNGNDKNKKYNKVYLKIIGNEIYLDLKLNCNSKNKKIIFNKEEINFMLNQFFKSNEELVKYYRIKKNFYN